jgi:uncharacterized damage-inducible protein DinB
MSMVDAVLQEFDNEAKTTRRVLERVPTDKLTWKPHPKSMSLGELALHVAGSPAVISGWCCESETTFTGEKMPEPKSQAEILAAHDQGVKTVKESLTKVGDEGLKEMWSAKAGGATLMQMPKTALVRAIVMNHWIHHRGQLSVYLRLLDIPVPSIYGPSADENPFAAAAAPAGATAGAA